MGTDGAADPGFAPAKVNLALHVTGRRGDGYHLLDSLAVFAGVGDRVAAAPAGGLTLCVTGPGAGALAGALDDEGDNLVLRAARFLAPGRGAAITLEKRLPVASGIGGGSSDAAAALRVLARLWGVALPAPAETAALGADVPVCLDPRPRRMGGIGEALGEVPALPPVWLVLANPGVAVPTGPVFQGLARRDSPPLPEMPKDWGGAAGLALWLRGTRNDLEAPAAAIAPAIGAARAALEAQAGCLVARMSGSGATVFGLFAQEAAATAAAAAIRRAEPGWWVAAAAVLR
jgi:4-diphosphocytidyl-2-C-methyl-D-erythritol kinase